MPDYGPDTLIAPPPPSALAGQLEACLVHIYPIGPLMGRRHALGAGKRVIGRSEACEIPAGENSVSRRHAELDWAGGSYAIRDLGSTNGTFVNDAVVTSPRTLCDGDTVRVGNCIYRFLAGGNVEAEYHEEIYRLTIMDGLTGLHNRRYFAEFLERELARSARHRRPLALLLVDLDHFKLVNDRHGHLCGDAVLREVASRLKPAVRREDLLARFGGEEFAVILVETDTPAAREVAERVRLAVGADPVRHDGRAVAVTVSVGVAATGGAETASTAEAILGRADRLLYQAKNAGRNRVEAEGDPCAPARGLQQPRRPTFHAAGRADRGGESYK